VLVRERDEIVRGTTARDRDPLRVGQELGRLVEGLALAQEHRDDEPGVERAGKLSRRGERPRRRMLLLPGEQDGVEHQNP
jgi:hypothetical protein